MWAVTNNDRVGWRKGVEIDQSGESEDDAIGTNWVEMVGNIGFISATHNDQVLAIESDDRTLYFRSGVTVSDPTGQKWHQIPCPTQLSRASSINAVTSRASHNDTPSGPSKSLGNLLKKNDDNAVSLDETSYSEPNQNAKYNPDNWRKSQQQRN